MVMLKTSRMNLRYNYNQTSLILLHLIKPRSSTSPKKMTRTLDTGLVDVNS